MNKVDGNNMGRGADFFLDEFYDCGQQKEDELDPPAGLNGEPWTNIEVHLGYSWHEPFYKTGKIIQGFADWSKFAPKNSLHGSIKHAVNTDNEGFFESARPETAEAQWECLSKRRAGLLCACKECQEAGL